VSTASCKWYRYASRLVPVALYAEACYAISYDMFLLNAQWSTLDHTRAPIDLKPHRQESEATGTSSAAKLTFYALRCIVALVIRFRTLW
jgi:hypothetical protein